MSQQKTAGEIPLEFKGTKFGTKIPYIKRYMFRQVSYGEILALTQTFFGNPTADKIKKWSIETTILAVTKEDGTKLTEEEIIALPAPEGSWIERQMADLGCVEYSFLSLPEDAAKLVTEAQKLLSKDQSTHTKH